MTAKPMFKLLCCALGALVLAAPAYAQKPDVKIEGEEEAPIPSADTMKDWPCVQGKVETLSVTAIWDGPSLDEAAAKEAAQGHRDFQSRPHAGEPPRARCDKAEEAIKKFADKQAPDARDKRLTPIVQRALRDGEQSAQDRHHRHRQVSEVAESALGGARAPEHRDRQAREDRRRPNEKAANRPRNRRRSISQWAQRIFQERQQSIPLACELPS